MGSMDRLDDRTFNVNFSGEGAALLWDTVKLKLKEFMPDYADDTLVEYVVVLLRNGRRKDEARNELDVFLGDDSDSFISWLWDHLAKNLDLYIKPEEPEVNDLHEVKPMSEELPDTADSLNLEPESEKGKSSNLSRSRRNREWKGLMGDAGEPPPLKSSESRHIHEEAKSYPRDHRARRSISPQHATQRKRSRLDERQHMKQRDSTSQTMDAPRRLLQFAVRDAVATSRPSDSAGESTLKRLRSVVSTTSEDVVDRPPRIRSVARVPNPMATVIKAVAEAARDVRKAKPSGNVFDRLSRAVEVSEPELVGEVAAAEDDEFEDLNQFGEHTCSTQPQRLDYDESYDGDMTMMKRESTLGYDYISDNEGYDEGKVTGHSDISQTNIHGGIRHEDSVIMQYSISETTEDDISFKRKKKMEQLPVTANSSHKMANIPVNANSWQPSRQQAGHDATKLDNQHPPRGSLAVAKNSDGQVIGNNKHISVANGNAQPAADTPKESQKMLSSTPGLNSTTRSLEDTDSRTVFVSNVHTAATKDSLSQHFNKFGEVLKVIINTDAATGQPIGSAVVEFTKKEAADDALSLDGSSFMSRVLRVVKRNTTLQKISPMTWPRLGRASPYARFSRVPFSRGIPGAFRSRLPVRPGARSLQWKRDAQGTPVEGGTSIAANSIPFFGTRRFTYVRTESKPTENTGGT
ncbi:uncharacterized protein LOC115756515 isoform X1 [Rhodamnia argentea]|uniref:Uncharacterized protein LOC115756515 isoform X1 n=1 Tax=Rhodamnia argentea TaxID=178133 RepID=A0A8B8QY97_9MYRT|nr:uncharacterized protein LOC115756515 isoform X1 [Rhodamnia argentea]